RGWFIFSGCLCGFIPLLSGACTGDRPTFPEIKSVDAAAPASGDGSSVEPGTPSVEPGTPSVEPSTSSVEPSTSSVEPSTSGVQSSASPNSGNVDADAPATGACPDGCIDVAAVRAGARL